MSNSLGNQIINYTVSAIKAQEKEKKSRNKKIVLNALKKWAIEAGNAGEDFYLNPEKGELGFQIDKVQGQISGVSVTLYKDEIIEVLKDLGFEIHNYFESSCPAVPEARNNNHISKLYDTYKTLLDSFRATEERKATEDVAVIMDNLKMIESLPKEVCSVREVGCIILNCTPQSKSDYYVQCVNKKLWEHGLCAQLFGWDKKSWEIKVVKD